MLKKILHKEITVYIAAIGGAFIVLFVVGYFSSFSSSYKNEWGLFKNPEKAAELYFAHPTNLPNKYSPGEVSSFTFAIADTNNSATTDYRYEVIQENTTNNTNSVLKSGIAKVERSQPYFEEITITYGDGGSRSRISVRLPEQDQSIHYWVERQ